MSEIQTGSSLDRARADYKELERTEESIRERMAELIINFSDGEAKDIQDFYMTMFGRNVRPCVYEQSRQMLGLGSKLERASTNDLVLLQRQSIHKKPVIDMGILRPDLLDTENTYSFGISRGPGIRAGDYTGTIRMPLQEIDLYPLNEDDPIHSNAQWITLGEVRGLDIPFVKSVTPSENLHIGFAEVAPIALESGPAAIRALTLYHNYMLERQASFHLHDSAWKDNL